MPRIRTIKPEFPQSESMGRVSREARLCFVLLWTLADDSGRLRGNSRMLASLLFPYDDDAPTLIDGWLAELEREQCLVLYQVDGATYLEISKWLIHQKIDKPSQSKIPPFDECSRILANVRESSPLDLGSKDLRIKDQGSGKGEGEEKKETRDKPARFDPLAIELPECINPSAWESWVAYRRSRKLTLSEVTLRMQLKNLESWWHDGHDPSAIIQASISNGWQGLFAPKGNAPPVNQKPAMTNEEIVDMIFAQQGRLESDE